MGICSSAIKSDGKHVHLGMPGSIVHHIISHLVLMNAVAIKTSLGDGALPDTYC